MGLLLRLIIFVGLLSSIHGQGEVELMEGASDWTKPAFRFGRDLRIINYLDPLFFCANVPNGFFYPKFQLRPRRRNTPGSNFWQFDPQYTHWNTRFRSEGDKYDRGKISATAAKTKWDAEGLWSEPQSTSDNDRFQDQMQYQVMDYGLYFNTEVTAIKDIGADGRILKGWFHLKVTLKKAAGAVSRSLLLKTITAGPQDTGKPKDGDFLIDRLVISARGLTLAEGTRPKEAPDLHSLEPVLAYTSGVGQFVQDFPNCADDSGNKRDDVFSTEPIESLYVKEQFMPCGSGNGREMMPGNQFIYVRTDDAKYGPTSDPNGDPDKTWKEIHVNFRLHHTFCNMFYEVDFVVVGIVASVNIPIKMDNFKDWDKYSEYPTNPTPDEKKVFYLQRSISTRLRFIKEKRQDVPRPSGPLPPSPATDDDFVFYEAADRVPEVDSVHCYENLKAEIINPQSVYYNAIKEVEETPSGALDRVDVSYYDLQMLSGEILTDYFEDVEPKHNIEVDAPNENKRRIKDEVKEWNTYNGHPIYDTSCRGYPLNQGSIGGDDVGVNQYFKTSTDCYDVSDDYKKDSRRNQIGLQLRPMWSGRCYLKVSNCESGNYREPALCDAGLMVQSGAWGDDKDSKRVNSLHPMVVKLKDWVQKTYWTYATYPPGKANGKDDQSGFGPDLEVGQRKNQPLTKNIWINTLDSGALINRRAISRSNNDFTLGPNEIAINNTVHEAKCSQRNQLIRESGGCPVLPPRPLTEATKAPDPTATTRRIKGKSKRRSKHSLRAQNKTGMRLDNPAAMYIWDSRVIHGVFLSILTMFVVPISIFISRYYKETFMNVRILYHHVWYFVHLFSSLMMLSLFLIGMWRQFGSRFWLGVNWDKDIAAPDIHRRLGWFIIFLTFFTFFLGGIRPMNRPVRGFIIMLHWVAGVFIYISLLVCMFLTVFIPGSPSVLQDNSVIDLTLTEFFTQEIVFLTIFIWILFDVGMHITMSVLAYLNDKLLLLSEPRLYLPSIIPVINENFRFDIPGFTARKYLLIVYVIAAAISTATICAALLLFSPVDRGLGWMTCTHLYDGTKRLVYPENCAFLWF